MGQTEFEKEVEAARKGLKEEVEALRQELTKEVEAVRQELDRKREAALMKKAKALLHELEKDLLKQNVRLVDLALDDDDDLKH
jgi:hypothetical protein